jgi:hypothetical protein
MYEIKLEYIKAVQQLLIVMEYNNIFNYYKFTLPHQESVRFSADANVRRRIQARAFYLMLTFYVNLQTPAVVRQTDHYIVSMK